MRMPAIDRSLLKALPLFSGMTGSELDHFVADASLQRFAKGNAVFHQGQTANAFFVLLQGRLKVVKVTPHGEQVVIRFVSPGDIFGIAKALGRQDYPATATAMVDSLALVWPNDVWDDLIARHPAFATNVMRMMGQRIQEAHARLKELSTEEVAPRIAHTILRLIEQSGRTIEEGVLIDFPITRQEIAEACGTTLHTVSRVLNAWEEADLVTLARRRIVVRAPQKLRQLAED